jgi:hypothetical protein
VKASVGAPTAILMDDDVAFLLWLGELFHENGYQTVPALDSRQAVALSRQAGLHVSILLVNPKLDGAEHMTHELLSANPTLRVILIRDASDSAADPDHPSIERPRAGEPISRSQWLTKVRQILVRAATT